MWFSTTYSQVSRSLVSFSATSSITTSSTVIEVSNTARKHRNTSKPWVNAFDPSVVRQTTAFIINYAETHGLVLLGRIPGYKRSDLQLLPSSTSKRQVWLQYCAAAEPGTKIVAYSTFCAFWHEYLPQVMVTKPMTDLCGVCHKNSTLLIRHSNRSVEEKSQVKQKHFWLLTCFAISSCVQVIKEAQEHLPKATLERSYYTSKKASTLQHMLLNLFSALPFFCQCKPQT